METRVINSRYQVKYPPLGQGGMGVVYRVYDTVTNRYVALKTVEGNVGAAALELFDREWSILAKLSHPNIIDILDAGTFRDGGEQRPYFVMPLLVGSTLDKVIKSSSDERMPLQPLVEVVVQVCRGLQAAHDQGLVHRDLKPSNIFVTRDKTVKIIDFGVAHLADTRSIIGVKGTLQYMAPEQMEMKAATPLSDIFSLGVVCYEALSGRRPFARNTESAVAEAIRAFVPPSLSEMNPEVNQLVGRTVHKAIAKQPWYRFSSAREFSETLQKAFKNEAIERFDRGRIQPRIDRAQKAHESGDFQFALDILNELESEGHVISGISLLREEAEAALRNRDIQLLLENAKVRLQEEEFPLALQKLQSALELDPKNAEVLAMKAEIDSRLRERQLENLFRVAQECLDHQLFAQARRAVEEILEVNASDTKVRNLMVRIEQAKQDFERSVAEQDELYEAACTAYERGELKNAQSHMEQLFESLRHKTAKLDARRDSQYQDLHQRIVSELEAVEKALADGRRCLERGDLDGALSICNRQLEDRPNNPVFQALKLEAEDTLRERRTAAIADFVRKAEAEPDLDKKEDILHEAATLYPDEPYFQQALSMISNRRSLINSMIERAGLCEQEFKFTEAISQWEMLRNIAPQYDGIETELRRLQERRDQQSREQAKDRWVDRFNRYFFVDDYAKAKDVIRDGLIEFPGDAGLLDLKKRAEEHIALSTKCKTLLEQAQDLFADDDYGGALEALKAVSALAQGSRAICVALLSALLDQARALLKVDWKTAQPFIQLAMQVDSGDPVARNLAAVLDDYKRKAAVEQYIAEAAALRENGSAHGALAKVEQALTIFPNELRLSQLHNALRSELQVADPVARPNRRESKPRASRWRPLVGALAAFNKPKPKSSLPPLKTLAASLGAAPTYRRPPASVAVLTNPLSANPISSNLVATKGSQEPAVPPIDAQISPPPQHFRRRSRIWVTLGLCISGVFLATGLFYELFPTQHKTNRSVARTAVSTVRLQANVAAAHIVIDGKLVTASAVPLTAGVHQAEVSKPGFQSVSKTFTVAPTNPVQTIEFTLAPLPAQLRMESELPDAKLLLDSGNAANLQGRASDFEIPLGTHEIELLSDNKKVLSFSVEATSDHLVSLSNLSKATPTPSVIVSSLGNSATLYTNSGWKLLLADKSTQTIPPSGLPIPDLESLHNQITVTNGLGEVSLAISSETSPLLSVSILNKAAASAIKGLVSVKANVPDASVLIDNVSLSNPMINGSKSVALAPGNYSIRVAKTGYEDVASQEIHVKEGETRTFSFVLIPVQTKSQLQLTGILAGSQIFLDGNQAGIAKPDGTFVAQVQPGSHSITLRKDGFDNTPITRDFKPNETTTIDAGKLLTALGTLTVKGKPSSAGVASIRKDGQSQTQMIGNDGTISLQPGQYYLSMKADGHPAHQVRVTIAAGSRAVINWDPGSGQPAAATPAQLMSKTVETPANWRIGSAGWWIYDGLDFGWLRVTAGSISVDILKQTMKMLFVAKAKKVEFTADYQDAGDQIDYVLDDHVLRRRITSHGVRGAETRILLEADAQSAYRIVLKASAEHVVVLALDGKVLDDVKRSNPQAPLGKIGFRAGIPLVATVTARQ